VVEIGAEERAAHGGLARRLELRHGRQPVVVVGVEVRAAAPRRERGA